MKIEEQNKYNEWHASHAEDNDTNTPWHNFAKKALKDLSLEGKQVLEIGCGRGGFAQYILKEHPRVQRLFACDYSESGLSIAKDKIGNDPRVQLQKEDIQKLSFESLTFDLIVSCETIEHVPKPLVALSELYRVLKPGGVFILTCPNYFNLFGIWCLYRKMIGKPFTEGGQPYVNYIQVPVIYGKLKSLGFEVQHYHSSEFIIPARRPRTYFGHGNPPLLKFFGYRTYYVLLKK